MYIIIEHQTCIYLMYRHYRIYYSIGIICVMMVQLLIRPILEFQ